MSNAFEDVKLWYVNHFRETHGICLADNYDEFVTKMLTAIMNALNEDYEIRRILDREMQSAISAGKTPAEWNQKKVNLLITMFFLALDECSYLKHEFAHHLYNELRKENPYEQV